MKPPHSPRHVWMNGTLVPHAEAKLPVEDRGLQFGESLYEVLPVTAGEPRLLQAHVDRMYAAASILGLEHGVPPFATWQALIRELVTRDEVTEGLLYAQLTGGSGPRLHLPEAAPTPSFFAYLTAFTFPRLDALRAGIRVITLPDARWARPEIKTTMLLPAVLAKREAKKCGATEAILIGPDDLVREGASSNVFIVEGSRVVTPRLTANVLPGVTRPKVLELSRQAGYETLEVSLALERFLAADEVFITSTTNPVMPVVTVDGRAVGNAVAGPVAMDLAARMQAALAL